MSNEKLSQPTTSDPRMQVSGPSIGLLVTGIIGGILELTIFIAGIFGTSFIALMEDEIPEKYSDLLQGTFWTASSFVGILVAAFIIYVSLKMKELNQWGLCVAASILAMIPCISPCCIIGLPIGIWCIIVLTKPEVKAAFS